MLLTRLVIQDFRNLAQVELTPPVGSTVAVGPNGQGKTNLLEAIYFLATLKPLRAAKIAELVRFGRSSARVTGRFLLHGAEREISVELSTGTRQASVDGKRTSKLEEYFGGVSVVAFTPEDLAVVKGGPELRRWFFDRSVFNRFPAFLKESRDYLKALKSRNKLLKDGAPGSYLGAFDEALARAGARVLVRRRALIREVAGKARDAFAAIGKTEFPARFDYSPGHLGEAFPEGDEPALAQALHAALVARIPRDLERGFTGVGPHTDDLTFELGDRSARAFASQGQQRALVLAWKIAEIENLQATLGHLPLLLLDDVSSELDPERNAYLMHYLAQSGAQVFLTTTDASLVREAASASTLWCQVRAGSIQPESGAGPGPTPQALHRI